MRELGLSFLTTHLCGQRHHRLTDRQKYAARFCKLKVMQVLRMDRDVLELSDRNIRQQRARTQLCGRLIQRPGCFRRWLLISRQCFLNLEVRCKKLLQHLSGLIADRADFL